MAESKNLRLRDLLIIPLIVGIIVGTSIAVFTFVLPLIFEKEKELSYTIDSPAAYLSEETVRDLKIEINGIETNSLYAYKVELWNSGDLPLKNLTIRYLFNNEDPDFQVFTVRHVTEPLYEFGSIREDDLNGKSKRFIYSFLNPGDRVTVTFLSNAHGTMSPYTKAEGLSVKQVEPLRDGDLKKLLLIPPVIAIIASLISQLLSPYYRRKFF